MTSHDLAKRLLAGPDRPILIVKPEGGPYTTEWELHPGGPWLTSPDHHGNPVRIAIDRQNPNAQAS